MFRWSAIASRLPGRTDNEIKNFWHTHLKKRLEQHNDLASTTTTKKRHEMTTNVTQNIDEHHIISSNYYQDSQIIVAYHPTSCHDQEDPQENNSSSHDIQSNKEENMQYSTNYGHGDMTSFNNDIVFWYNVFMSSGNNASDEIN